MKVMKDLESGRVEGRLRFKTCLPAFEEETSQAPPVLSALRLIRGESLLQDQIQAAPVPKMSSNHFRPGL